MFDEMSECCIKVYALEKVLKIKKNPTTLTPFLDDVVKELDNRPSALFWMSLGAALDKHFRDTAKSAFFLWTWTFADDWPQTRPSSNRLW